MSVKSGGPPLSGIAGQDRGRMADVLGPVDPPDPFAPTSLRNVTLRNRIVKAATFEGVTHDHVVSDALIEFHRRVAAGGVGMTTVAYCAVSPEGCGTPNEIILTPGAIP